METISRVLRPKATARKNYTRMSRWYDLFAASERKYKFAGLKQLAVRPGERVLEIGFGTGECLSVLAQSVGEDGLVCGIDLSEGMTAVARKKLWAQKVAAPVFLQLGDATTLPYRRATFDVVFISFTLELFDTPEIPQVLAECRRVLPIGGRLGVVSLAKGETEPWMVRLYEWSHRHFPAWMDCRPIFAEAFVAQAKFEIESAAKMMMYGLPVAVITARKSP